MFTQPLMYKKIRQHKNAHQQYVERLLTEGDISKQQVRGQVGRAVYKCERHPPFAQEAARPLSRLDCPSKNVCSWMVAAQPLFRLNCPPKNKSSMANASNSHAGLYGLCVQVRGVHDRVQDILNTEYEASRSYRPSTKDWLASHWQGFMSPAQLSRIRNTGETFGLHMCVGWQQVWGRG
jgi:2-oxoglutarate dehydrogenase complex dehydrogenase (E1) component-like enzyme